MRHPVTWVYAILLVIGVIGLVPLLTAAFEGAPAGFLLAVALWTGFTLLAWWAVRRLSRTRPRPRLATLAAFAWGAIIATGLGRWATGGIGDIAGAVIPDEGWAGAIAAGVSEEPLKLLGVFALSLFAVTRMRSTLDFIYYGAFVGLGFMVVESLLYAAQGAQTGDSPMTIVVEYVVLRGILAALWSHPTFTALAAIGLAVLVRSEASAVRRWLAFLGMLVLSMALHALFDSPVLESDAMTAFFAKGAIVLVVFLGFYLPLRRRADQAAPAPREETPEPASASS